MSARDAVATYFTALCNRDGVLARSIFTDDGAIDDYVGRHHSGGAAIEAFISQVVRRRLKILSEFVAVGQRWTVVAEISYEDGRVSLVRWVFHVSGDKITHVGNTAVREMPESWRRPEPIFMESN